MEWRHFCLSSFPYQAGFLGDMHALDLEKRQVHSVKVSGGPYSTSLYKIRITFAEGVDPESVPLAVQWYRSKSKGRFERIKGATSMAYLPNADDMMTQLGVACLPCTAETGQVGSHLQTEPRSQHRLLALRIVNRPRPPVTTSPADVQPRSVGLLTPCLQGRQLALHASHGHPGLHVTERVRGGGGAACGRGDWRWDQNRDTGHRRGEEV